LHNLASYGVGRVVLTFGKTYGKYISALWDRLTPDVGTTWRTTQGEEIAFAPGQIWIALTDKEPVFTPIPSKIPADASSAPAK
jgi:hypothetical protein